MSAKPLARYALGMLFGVLCGAAVAVVMLWATGPDSGVSVGPWVSGTDFGSSAANDRTRAVIAIRGLLALPASEARYYSVETDDSGASLDGRCSYRITGGALPTRWWSLTLYDERGYLVANTESIYSLVSLALAPQELEHWTLLASPKRQPGHWLPTGNIEHFNLTLRAYLPDGGGRQNFTRAQLPTIQKLECH